MNNFDKNTKFASLNTLRISKVAVFYLLCRTYLLIIVEISGLNANFSLDGENSFSISDATLQGTMMIIIVDLSKANMNRRKRMDQAGVSNSVSRILERKKAVLDSQPFLGQHFKLNNTLSPY